MGGVWVTRRSTANLRISRGAKRSICDGQRFGAALTKRSRFCVRRTKTKSAKRLNPSAASRDCLCRNYCAKRMSLRRTARRRCWTRRPRKRSRRRRRGGRPISMSDCAHCGGRDSKRRRAKTRRPPREREERAPKERERRAQRRPKERARKSRRKREVRKERAARKERRPQRSDDTEQSTFIIRSYMRTQRLAFMKMRKHPCTLRSLNCSFVNLKNGKK